MRKLIPFASFLLAACGSTLEVDDRWAIPENINFPAALGVDLTQMNKTASGLYWQDLLVNAEGAAVQLDDRVRLHHRIWLPDATEVENTYQSMPVQSDVRLLIPGVAEGISGVSATGAQQDMPPMRVGSKRKLVIRPELAWGNRGNGSIPPRTTIVYEVEILAIIGS